MPTRSDRAHLSVLSGVAGLVLSGLAAMAPATGAQEVSGEGPQVVRLEWGEGINPGGSGHRQANLSTQPPAHVTHAPDADGLWWGELTLGAGGRYAFAVQSPAEPSGAAMFFVDRNGDGNFLNDQPSRIGGEGTQRTAARIAFDVPTGATGPRPYEVWLWTTLRPGQTSSETPIFALYAVMHRRGTLTVREGQAHRTLAVYVGDNRHTDASFRSDGVMVDWNGNGQSEKIDGMRPGELKYVRGALVCFRAYDAEAGTATFEVSYPAAPPEGVVNVDDFLAGQPTVGKAPPALDVPDLEGRAISLGEYRDRVLLVDFWATWCGPCVQEMPNVRAVYERFHERGFDIVGVSLDTDLGALRDYVARERIPWRQTCDGRSWQGDLVERWRVQGIPAAFLIGIDGRIVSLHANGPSLATLVEQELAKAR